MKILVDENILYASELFGRIGEVIAVPGRSVMTEALNDIDVLMVRSVTQVNETLLSNKAIIFVGTATAGTDHIDENFLAQQKIGFSSAPGCNAIAVVEYVFSALLMLAERDGFQFTDRTIGIVGVGHIGSRLQQRLEALGIKTLLCDPPRADSGDTEDFLPLETLVAQADVLTFHTPLIKNGRYQTLHMVDEALLYALKPNTILINTCRGQVVDNVALLRVLQQRNDLSIVLDVWETEPNLHAGLLKLIDIGTAHIAGYTLEGKARGTTQVFEALTRFIGQEQQVSLETLLPVPKFDYIMLHGSIDQVTFKLLAHLVYDVHRDDATLRRVINQPGKFDRLRKQYQERREWSSLHVQCDDADAAVLLKNLGFSAVYQPPNSII